MTSRKRRQMEQQVHTPSTVDEETLPDFVHVSRRTQYQGIDFGLQPETEDCFMTIPDVLSEQECTWLIDYCSRLENEDRLIENAQLRAWLSEKIASHIPPILRVAVNSQTILSAFGGFGKPHFYCDSLPDTSTIIVGEHPHLRSKFKALVYLNTLPGEQGGSSVFHRNRTEFLTLEPIEGKVVLFDQRIPHTATQLMHGHRYLLVMDLMYLESHSEEDCGICLETLGKSDERPKVRLTCGHAYHRECVDPWFRHHLNCPKCRRVIPVSDLTSLQISYPRRRVNASPMLILDGDNHEWVPATHLRRELFQEGTEDLTFEQFEEALARAQRPT
ncbi:hypothetical protein EDD86DRAFT_74152 [Gorgonomyces haynaldii]|nr:hypothetical protein EDD86DRAFT_74152 [Gorgonomyces haynaldii]